MPPPGVVYHPLETMDERAQMLGELSEVLREVGADHALVGGLAVGYHGRLRATIDVDLLVPLAKLDELAVALAARGYVIARTPMMVRVFSAGADPDRDEAIAHLLGREANLVLAAAAQAIEPALVLGHRVNIVQRGALVALKFHAAISTQRELADRYQDLADIGRIIKKELTAEDERLALAIAGRAYPGADVELAQILDDLRHGRPVKI